MEKLSKMIHRDFNDYHYFKGCFFIYFKFYHYLLAFFIRLFTIHIFQMITEKQNIIALFQFYRFILKNKNSFKK